MTGTVTVNDKAEEKAGDHKQMIQKTYFDVLGLCCSSEVALIERIITSLEGIKDVSVIVPSKTVIVVHDSTLISAFEIAKTLNQARLEANVRVNGKTTHRKKWPSLYVIACGLLLGLSSLKYVYSPLGWLAVLAVGIGIWPIVMRGIAAVRNLTLDINILVIITVAGTLALKDFWEAGTIVFLFTIAEWLQSRASHEANAVMSSLMSIAPQQAIIAETGELVNVEDVKLGTVLAVKTGEVIPIDGFVVDGNCEVDEKTLTGEAFPVPKQKDSTVWAGTINLNGYVSVKTSARPEDCVVAKMAKLVEEAQNKKPRFQRLVDEFAKYYTPAVVLLSVGLAVVPAAMKVHNIKHWFHLALVVLVSACPCGLILSTPVATFCALSKAASSGLLIKGGDYIETLSKVKTVAFDKTGTITRGEFILTGFRCLSSDITLDTLLYWVSSIESKSSHPIADAVVSYGKSQAIEPKPEIVEEFQNFPGEGVAGKIEGRTIYVGNRKFNHRAGCLSSPEIKCTNEDGRTLSYVYSGGAEIGTFSLSDACRSGSINAIKDLKSMGIRTAMLTGDSNAAATHAHDQLDRTLDEVHAELLPEDKARIIEDYKKFGPTAMVGDGVNDAPALATADVGISMGVSGSALASETGHVILMSNDIRRIPKAIRLARRTQHKVIQNIVFSIATKVVVLALAAAGHPFIWLAVLADVLTCLLVIMNSMLLLRGSHRHGHGKCSGSSHHHHNHNHVHSKKGTCDGSLELNHVHDHEGSCHSSGVHKHSCSSNNVAMRKCKAAKCSSLEEHSISCRSHVDPLHQHQHASGGVVEKVKSQCCSEKSGRVKAPECSSLGCSHVSGVDAGCGGRAHEESRQCEELNCDSFANEECCKSLSTQRPCQKEKCRDLEGQVARCLGVECANEASSHEPSSNPDSSCHHQTECCEVHTVDKQISYEIATNNAEQFSCSHVEEPKNTVDNEIRHSGCHHGASTGHTHDHNHNHNHTTMAHKDACVEMTSNREVESCCKSFIAECCRVQGHPHTHTHFAAGLGGGLTEIVSE